MWERACPRKRSVRQCMCRLIHRLRGQARSHLCMGFHSDLLFEAKVGRLLAIPPPGRLLASKLCFKGHEEYRW
ncbi:hypothetical protein DBR46_12855 [Pseudomonas sp. KBW05]|nr:hypothetical protein DBR46_12855 [Pseudomonas sp. KBW05]